MIDNGDRTDIATLCLEYGADEDVCPTKEIELSPHGLTFQSSWSFEVGTCLGVSVSRKQTDGGHSGIQTEGVVVDCRTLSGGTHKSTLLFVQPVTPTETTFA